MPDLITLHDKINAIAPIDGISDNGDSTYRIDWKVTPTTEQLTAATGAIALWQAEPNPDWDGLLDDLQESAVFARAYSAGNESIPAVNAFQMLIASVTSTKRLSNLLFAFGQLRAAMVGTVSGDFNLSELEWLSDRLGDRGFPVDSFGL